MLLRSDARAVIASHSLVRAVAHCLNHAGQYFRYVDPQLGAGDIIAFVDTLGDETLASRGKAYLGCPTSAATASMIGKLSLLEGSNLANMAWYGIR